MSSCHSLSTGSDWTLLYVQSAEWPYDPMAFFPLALLPYGAWIFGYSPLWVRCFTPFLITGMLMALGGFRVCLWANEL